MAEDSKNVRFGPILSKDRMYDLLQRGCLGNIVPQWNSLEETLEGVKAYPSDSLVSLRSKQVTNPVKLYHVPIPELCARVAALPKHHTKPGLVFSLAPPDHRRTIQGELSRTAAGLTLTYTTVRLPMRLALLQERHDLLGLRALAKLKANLPAGDVDWLLELLDTYCVRTDDPLIYPRLDTVVEFSAFNCPVGVVPGSQMVIWEVRAY